MEPVEGFRLEMRHEKGFRLPLGQSSRGREAEQSRTLGGIERERSKSHRQAQGGGQKRPSREAVS